jgi:hypothetical protein
MGALLSSLAMLSAPSPALACVVGLAPEGAIELTANTTVPELAAIAEREGYSYRLNAREFMARRAPQNRADLGCGCRLFYPQSAVATQ